MRELQNPTLLRDGFKDSRDIRVALDELTDISRMRSQAHEDANLFRDFHIEPGSSRERQLRGELAGARGVLARWAVMAAHHEFRTVDLARIENDGLWDATTRAEEGIGDLAMDLFMDGRIGGIIERDSSEAKLRISIDPGLLSRDGLIAIRRKRLMLATTSTVQDFIDTRTVQGGTGIALPRRTPLRADVSMEVDKVSEFVLDVRRLEEIAPDALLEIRDVTQNGSRPGEITGNEDIRMAPAVIEAAIAERDPMVIPAITTYYADRKYRNVREQADEKVKVAV